MVSVFKRNYLQASDCSFYQPVTSLSLGGHHDDDDVHALCRSIMSDSLQPHRLLPARLLCPWDFPGKNTGVGCHFLL